MTVHQTGGTPIRVLTPSGGSVVDIIPADACAMCYVPYPNKIYAVTPWWTYVIDCDSQTVSESLSCGGFAVVSDTMHGKVYGCGYYAGTVYMTDARADTFIAAIPLGRYPEPMCWNRTNSRVYVADEMDDVVYVIRDTSVGIGESELVSICPRSTSARILTGTLIWTGSRPAELMDLCGRVVAALRQGRNDLSRLSPGVYVTRELGSMEHTKVVKLK